VRGAPSAPRRLLAGIACLSALAACAADPSSGASEPATYEARSGVPVLMDLPVIGWLFQHRVTAR